MGGAVIASGANQSSDRVRCRSGFQRRQSAQIPRDRRPTQTNFLEATTSGLLRCARSDDCASQPLRAIPPGTASARNATAGATTPARGARRAAGRSRRRPRDGTGRPARRPSSRPPIDRDARQPCRHSPSRSADTGIDARSAPTASADRSGSPRAPPAEAQERGLSRRRCARRAPGLDLRERVGDRIEGQQRRGVARLIVAHGLEGREFRPSA